jgi:YfiR/HmsC-like
MRTISGCKSALVIAALLITTNATAQTVDEYRVKAAFVFNFAKFIQWPTEAFKTPSDPLVICVVGQDQMADSLRETVNGNAIDGRPVVIRQIAIGRGPCDCHILFVGASAMKGFRSHPKELTGVLIIGETPGFAGDGGAINLKLEGGRVRFEINVAEAERQQLHISSKLLSLAQVVKK